MRMTSILPSNIKGRHKPLRTVQRRSTRSRIIPKFKGLSAKTWMSTQPVVSQGMPGACFSLAGPRLSTLYVDEKHFSCQPVGRLPLHGRPRTLIKTCLEYVTNLLSSLQNAATVRKTTNQERWLKPMVANWPVFPNLSMRGRLPDQDRHRQFCTNGTKTCRQRTKDCCCPWYDHWYRLPSCLRCWCRRPLPRHATHIIPFWLLT